MPLTAGDITKKNTNSFTLDGKKKTVPVLPMAPFVNGKLLAPKPEVISDTAEVKLSDFDHLRITKERNIPQPEPTITIGGAAVAAPKNITGIGAASKAGKTALNNVIQAGAISKTGNVDGFKDLSVMPNTEGKAVINFDTEQSEADQQQNVFTILKRAGFDKTPDYYRAYNIRQLKQSNYKEVTDQICELCSREFGGIHLITIDGGADYIKSVNDEEQATDIVQYYIHKAIDYNCAVIIIVHQNPNSDKERGHFGSEIQRKCYGLLSITKQADISTVEPKIMRKAGNEEFPLIKYQYSKEKGYHIEVDAPDQSDTKAQKANEFLKALALEIFAPPGAFTHTDSLKRVMDKTKKQKTAAKEKIQNMVLFDFVTIGIDGLYRLNIDKVGLGRIGSD